MRSLWAEPRHPKRSDGAPIELRVAKCGWYWDFPPPPPAPLLSPPRMRLCTSAETEWVGGILESVERSGMMWRECRGIEGMWIEVARMW